MTKPKHITPNAGQRALGPPEAKSTQTKARERARAQANDKYLPRLIPIRPRPAPLTGATLRELLLTLGNAASSLKAGESLPSYLLVALRRYQRALVADTDRVLAYKYAMQASMKGAPLSERASRDVRETAFDVAAKKLGRSASWVADAYRNRYPRQKKRTEK